MFTNYYIPVEIHKIHFLSDLLHTFKTLALGLVPQTPIYFFPAAEKSKQKNPPLKLKLLKKIPLFS